MVMWFRMGASPITNKEFKDLRNTNKVFVRHHEEASRKTSRTTTITGMFRSLERATIRRRELVVDIRKRDNSDVLQ